MTLNKKQQNPNQKPKKLDLMLLMNLKQMGFSLEGINILQLRDAIELTNYYMGDSEGSDENFIPKATQADIDKMLGR